MVVSYPISQNCRMAEAGGTPGCPCPPLCPSKVPSPMSLGSGSSPRSSPWPLSGQPVTGLWHPPSTEMLPDVEPLVLHWLVQIPLNSECLQVATENWKWAFSNVHWRSGNGDVYQLILFSVLFWKHWWDFRSLQTSVQGWVLLATEVDPSC